MKKLILLFFVCLHVLDSFGQILNPSFGNPTLQPCPFDSTQTIMTPEFWFAYQTQNDKWNGPMDSTQCITFKDTSGRLIIEMSTIDATKPLFVKNMITDSTKFLLEKDFAYNQIATLTFPNNEIVNFSTNCHNDMCAGTITGIEIPDSSGTGTFLREYHNPATSGLSTQWETCIVTEKFDTSYLREFVIKYSLLNPITDDKWFNPIFIDFFDSFFFGSNSINSNTTVPEWSFSTFDSSYNINIHDVSDMQGGWEAPHMLMYIDSTYPSSDYPSFVEIFPPENDSIQQTINVNIDVFQSFVAQPFANIRGGLVTGNDSVRHVLNIVNDGGDLCFSFIFIDLWFDDQTNYIHNGGTVNLKGEYSCMQFSRGSKFIVGDDTYFNYGEHGRGYLAMRSGGSIEIGKNSTLEINNTLTMHELRGVTESQQIYMELNKGSRLIFGKNARLHNAWSIDQNMKLNIYMNGGTLDDSNLSPEDRAKINLIYPEPPVRIQDNIKVFPNPTSQFLNYSFILKNEATITIEMYDITGRFIFSKIENGQKGWNDFQTDISMLNSGVYFFKVKMTGEEMVTKIIKI